MPDNSKTKAHTVDLLMLMGQSNMAGRGVTNEVWPEPAPELIEGAGYEFRAISDPTRLYPIAEPFGAAENKSGGIDDGLKKSGSLVTAFVNAYYSNNGYIPVVGVSASKGGSKLSQWQIDSEERYLEDAIGRFVSAKTWLENNGYSVRHKYAVWCQGESDGDVHTPEANFKTMFNAVLFELLNAGIEKLLMIRIGNCNVAGDYGRYSDVIRWETEIAQTDENVVMVSCDFAGMRERGLMKDDFHYYQQGYNECGTNAGIIAAKYVTTGMEPAMYDSEYGDMYCSRK